MTTFLKLMGVLLFAAGIAACVYFLGQGNLTGREQGLLSILLTTLSMLATWVVSHTYSTAQHESFRSSPGQLGFTRQLHVNSNSRGGS